MPITKRKLNGGGKTAPHSLKKRKLQTSAKTTDVFSQGELAVLNKTVLKNHGPNTIRKASDRKADYGRLNTGILSLDLALAGGWKLSRGHMIYGERSSGKSTVALLTAAQTLRKYPDEAIVWIDVEGTFDRVWAERLGVDCDRLLVVEPDTGEEALDLVDAYLQVKEVRMTITDSIAFISPQKEIEESVEKALMGNHALLIGKFLRKANAAVIRERKRGHHVVSMYLNQFRMKIGQMFGDPRTLPGGRALEYAVSQNLLMINKEHTSKGKSEESDGDEVSGTVLYNEHTFRVTKDKTGGRIKEGMFKLIRDEATGFPSGYIEQAKTIVKFAKLAGLYSGGGKSQRFEGIPHTFGNIDEIQKFFLENPDAMYDLNDRIIAHYVNKWGLNG